MAQQADDARTSDRDRQALAQAMALQQAGRLEEAVRAYRALLARHRGNPRLTGYLGLALVQLGRNGEALAVLEPAAAADGEDAGLQNALALALGAQGRHREAAAAAGAAARLKPEVAELQVNLGNALRQAGETAAALAAYRRALALKPGLAPAQLGLGMVHAATGDRSAAVACYRQALEQRPGYAKAFYQLALTAKVAAKEAAEAVPPDLVEAFERRLASGAMAPDDAIATHSGLGFLHDRAGATDRAFHHFAAANALALERRLARGEAFDPEAHDRLVEGIVAAFPRDFAVAPAGPPGPWPILVVGMPRSGTTLVEQIIAAHPAVTGGGELEALPRLVAGLAGYPASWPDIDPARRAALAEAYAAALAEVDPAAAATAASSAAPTAARVTDKQPMNHLHLGLVAALFPEARLVHCRRDPLDTGLSIFMQNFVGNYAFAYELGDIARAIRACERLMAHWRAVLPPGRLIEVDYEDLVSRPRPVIGALIEGLGLPWEEACLDPAGAARPVHTASQLQVREPISEAAVGRWRRYRAHLGALIEGLQRDPL